jgi:hypothetical protein
MWFAYKTGFSAGERYSQVLFSKVLRELKIGKDRQATGRAWAKTQNQERQRPNLEWRIRFTLYSWKGLGDVLVQYGT